LGLLQPDLILPSNVSFASSHQIPMIRTELDSHANMFVMGKHCIVLNDSGLKASVNAYSPGIQPKTIPIVDAAIAYDCPFHNKTYILVASNALYVPEMDINLAAPFIMREAGVEVCEKAKIHVEEPTKEHHSLYFEDYDLRIPLGLNGIFSYFETRMPSEEELCTCEHLNITPDGPNWNPHDDRFSRAESRMIDWEGNIVERVKGRRIIDDDDDDDEHDGLISSLSVAAMEAIVDEVAHQSVMLMSLSLCGGETNCNDVTSSVMACDHNSNKLVNDLNNMLGLSKYCMSIGACVSFNDRSTLLCSAVHAETPKCINADRLSKVWQISKEQAQRTLNVTTQRVRRSDDIGLSRNYPTNDRMVRYRRVQQHFFMDTFFASVKSLRGYTCCQMFVSDKGFVQCYNMKSKAQVPQTLRLFAKEVGVPDAIICDKSGEQTSGEVKELCYKFGTTLRQLEEHTPWANKAELYIGLIKRAVLKDLKESDCPLVLWDYCIERRAMINNLTARDLFNLQGQTPFSSVMGYEGDISNLCQFKWYDWCYFREQGESFPKQRDVLARVLGPSKDSGNAMAQWVLKSNGRVVARRTCRPLTNEEWHSEVEKRKRNIFDEVIKHKLGTSIKLPAKYPQPEEYEVYEDDIETVREMPEADELSPQGGGDSSENLYDLLVSAEVMLPDGGEMKPARVKNRARDQDGNPVGAYNSQPFLNTAVYDVEFPDGAVKQYAANVIAENMYSQVDIDGHRYNLLDEIVDYRKDGTALSRENMYVISKRGNRSLKKTTRGWDLLVKWKNGNTQWIHLKDIKESNPIEVAEFAQVHGIDKEPAFVWWVPYTLKKRDRIIAAVNSSVKNSSQKYGIQVPRTVQEALELDRINGNDFWRKAINKEMSNVMIAFEILEDDKQVPPGWSKVTGHMIFDVKMDFTRKARWVLDGHKTPDIDGSSYAGVVSRESVRIALTYAALNEIDLMAADIRNAYLQAPTSQKHYIVCGPEFGIENAGKRALIHRALYGGKTAGRDFRNHLRSCMDFLGFKSCVADPDVWMRESIRANGGKYWEYVLLYTDDTLVISERAESILRNEIGKYFELKEESIGEPKIYLGGKVRKVILENGTQAWSFSSSQYVQAAVENVENHLHEKGLKLPTRANTPLSNGYRPEVDTSELLVGVDLSYYQSLIGVLRWMVELGRVDICCEVSMMSSYLAMPRIGHLQQLFNMFAYLKKYHNSEMVFDPSYPEIDKTKFQRQDWSATAWGDGLVEEIPANLPEPRGYGMMMRAFVDADHAGDLVTRRSRTGFIVYLNMAPIYWLSKRQTSIETSSFGSEFVAMKQCCEYVRGLRFKIRAMGIPCEDPTFIFGDNQSVLWNTTIPDSTLKKKSNSIAYHFVREGCAKDEWRTAYVNTHENPADLLTKPLSGEKRSKFVRMIQHHIYGSTIEVDNGGVD
jgi:hypothetical protein